MARAPSLRTTRITSIHYDGPFFTKDPGKTFRANVRTMMRALGEEAQRDVETQMRHNEGRRAPIAELGDHASRHVVSRVKSLRGKPWEAAAVISVNNQGFTPEQGVSLMAAASEVERQTGANKRTASRLRKSRKINVAELLKGIN